MYWSIRITLPLLMAVTLAACSASSPSGRSTPSPSAGTTATAALYSCPSPSAPPTAGHYPFKNNNAVCIPGVPQSITDRLPLLTPKPLSDAAVSESKAEQTARTQAYMALFPGSPRQGVAPPADSGLSLMGSVLAQANVSTVTIPVPSGEYGTRVYWFFIYYSTTNMPHSCGLGPSCGEIHHIVVAVNATSAYSGPGMTWGLPDD